MVQNEVVWVTKRSDGNSGDLESLDSAANPLPLAVGW